MRRRERLRGLRDQIRSTRTGRLTLQVVIAAVGTVVVVLGIVLIPFPGPGWLIVIAGLAIWAIEFVWARRLLTYTRDRLERWWRWLGRQHWSVRVFAGALGLAVTAAIAWVSLRYGRYIATH
jgi:uncharacterized protein (TIGR02611 family)